MSLPIASAHGLASSALITTSGLVDPLSSTDNLLVVVVPVVVCPVAKVVPLPSIENFSTPL